MEKERINQETASRIIQQKQNHGTNSIVDNRPYSSLSFLSNPTTQRISEEDEEIMQGKFDSSVQRMEDEKEETLQCKFDKPIQKKNETGMPDKLKEGIESLSGFSMDDVRVHYNSSKPATVQALAYTQGTDIHVAPGQEKHLPHEAWHVTQQMAGRVSPTTNINGMPVNDNAALEHEADVMGEKALGANVNRTLQKKFVDNSIKQCITNAKYAEIRKYLTTKFPNDSFNVQTILNAFIYSKNKFDTKDCENLINSSESIDDLMSKLRDSSESSNPTTAPKDDSVAPGETINTSVASVDEHMDDTKILELKKCPEQFTNITIYHGDERDYLLEVGISTCNTEKWEEEYLRNSILESRTAAEATQKQKVENVIKLPKKDFDSYISVWIHNAGQGVHEDLCRMGRSFIGWCCSMYKSNTQKKIIYEIKLNDTFRLIKKGSDGNALYKGDLTGIILQFAEVTSDQGEVDILSTICVKPSGTPNICTDQDGRVTLKKI